MKLAAIIFLVCLFLLAKVPPLLGMVLSLTVLVLIGYIIHGVLLGAWRLVYYGGRNQRDKARG